MIQQPNPCGDRWRPDRKRTERLAHGVALSVIAKHLDGDDATAAHRYLFTVVDGRSWVTAFAEHVAAMEKSKRETLATMPRLDVLRAIEAEAQCHCLQWIVASAEAEASSPGT